MPVIHINSEPVELCKLLKFEGIAPSGASAKHMISNEEVMVNNQIETRKRKKLMAGDIITIDNNRYVLTLNPSSSGTNK